MERLHKALAAAGVASRRASEVMIAAGRVAVNGQVVTTAGVQVSEADSITLDGKPVERGSRRTYLALHKPPGFVTTANDPQGRPTVLGIVAATPGAPKGRVYPVGRLDADSEGLVLLTDDGELTFRLTHPRFALEKEYRVLVEGVPAPAALATLRSGVLLEGRATAPARVSLEVRGGVHRAPGTAAAGAPTSGEETWLRFVIHEGRKRQIRRMCLAVGHPVRRLIRVRIGDLRLGSLAPGQVRSLTAAETAKLKELTGLASTSEPVAPIRRPSEPIDDHNRRSGGSRQERPGRTPGGAAALPVLRHGSAVPGRGVASPEARDQGKRRKASRAPRR